jgi:PRC-barrel domain
MRGPYLAAVTVAMTLFALSATAYLAAQDRPAAQPQIEQPPAQGPTSQGPTTQVPAPQGPPAQVPNAPPREPTETILNNHEVQGILGKEVRSAADEDMGRIVDVIVDRGTGQVRAAIIDFGGFLGVGSRKIAVAWDALHFPPKGKVERIALELTRDQVRAAPEYKEGKPVVVLGASGSLESLPYQ